MAVKEVDNLIITDLRSGIGGDHSSRLYTITDTKSGETGVVFEYKLIKRYPIQDIEKARSEYDLLGSSGLWLHMEQLINLKKYGSHVAPKAAKKVTK